MPFWLTPDFWLLVVLVLIVVLWAWLSIDVLETLLSSKNKKSKSKEPEETREDLMRVLTAVARAGTKEGGKDPDRAAEKYIRMDKNGQ